MGRTSSVDKLAALDKTRETHQEVATKQSAANRLALDAGAERIPETDEDGNAKISMPEAVATAVIGTVLFGPLGGVLLGGAQGILMRNEKQSVLDQMLSEKNAITESADIYKTELEKAKAAAQGNAEELAELGMVEAQFTAGMEFLEAGMNDQAMTSITGGQQSLSSFNAKNEVQRIAFDAEQARLKVELGDKQYDRYSTMKKDYNAESQPYMETMRFGDMTLRALEGGTPAQIYAAMIAFNKTIDPNSAVLGEEREALATTGSWTEQGFQGFLEKWNGSAASSKQRRQLVDATRVTMGAMQRQQSVRETDYADRLSQDDFDPKYNDDFMVSQKFEPYVPTIEPDAAEIAFELDRAAQDKQSMTIGDIVDSTKASVSNFVDRRNAEQDERSIVIGDAIDNVRKGIPNAMQDATNYLQSLGGFAAGGNRPQNN